MPLFRRRRPVTPSVNASPGTVGLDHVVARGVGNSARHPRLRFNHGVTEYHVDAWKIWREWMLDTYRFGRSRHRVIEVAKPRDAVLEFKYDSDYRSVRALMADAGLAVSPFDTITPEDITNGAS